MTRLSPDDFGAYREDADLGSAALHKHRCRVWMRVSDRDLVVTQNPVEQGVLSLRTVGGECLSRPMTATAPHPHRVSRAVAGMRATLTDLAPLPLWSMNGPEAAETLHELVRLLGLPGYHEEPFRQLPRHFEFGPDHVKDPQPAEDWKQWRGFAHLFPKGSGAVVGAFDFR